MVTTLFYGSTFFLALILSLLGWKVFVFFQKRSNVADFSFSAQRRTFSHAWERILKHSRFFREGCTPSSKDDPQSREASGLGTQSSSPPRYVTNPPGLTTSPCGQTGTQLSPAGGLSSNSSHCPGVLSPSESSIWPHTLGTSAPRWQWAKDAVGGQAGGRPSFRSSTNREDFITNTV